MSITQDITSQIETVKLCATVDDIKIFRQNYDLYQDEYTNPYLVLLNNSKLAILSKRGLHDLRSTSMFSQMILVMYFGPLHLWSISCSHSYVIENNIKKVIIYLNKSKGLKNYTDNTKHIEFSTDLPNLSESTITKFMILRTGSYRDCNKYINNSNFVIFILLEWTFNNQHFSSAYDIQYITSNSILNKMFLQQLRTHDRERFVIPNVIKGFQYNDIINENYLTSSCVNNTVMTNSKPTRHQNVFYEERYFVNKSLHSYVKSKAQFDSVEKLVGLILLSSNTINYQPNISDFLWMSDNHALSLFEMVQNEEEDDRATEAFTDNESDLESVSANSLREMNKKPIAKRKRGRPPKNSNVFIGSTVLQNGPTFNASQGASFTAQSESQGASHGASYGVSQVNPFAVTQQMFQDFVQSTKNTPTSSPQKQSQQSRDQELREANSIHENNQVPAMLSNNDNLDLPWSGGEIKNVPSFDKFNLN